MTELPFVSRVLVEDNTIPEYPNCKVTYPSFIGDGHCEGGEYNTEECGFDGGDCIDFNEKYPNCKVDDPYRIADEYCKGGDYNTEECGFDGGKCIDFNEKYPNCKVDYPTNVGDGLCDGGDYNTEECGWDGGDCPFSRGKRLLSSDYLVYSFQVISILLALFYA